MSRLRVQFQERRRLVESAYQDAWGLPSHVDAPHPFRGGSVVALGRARATRYGLRRQVTGLEPDTPVLRIDAWGDPHSVGKLICLAAEETAWLPTGNVFKGDGLVPLFAEAFLAVLAPITLRHRDVALDDADDTVVIDVVGKSDLQFPDELVAHVVAKSADGTRERRAGRFPPQKLPARGVPQAPDFDSYLRPLETGLTEQAA